MRVLVVDTYYPPFVERHYAERPDLPGAPYDAQLASLLERHFGTGDAYGRELRALGHEAQTVIVNVPQLQTAWAREHGAVRTQRLLTHMPTRIGFRARDDLPRRIALEQIAAFAPDVVYLQDLWFFGRESLDAIRATGALVVGQIASDPPGPEVLTGFDLIVTSFPHFVPRFEALGVEALYLPIAFDTSVRDALEADGVAQDPQAPRATDVSFVGTLNPRTHAAGTALLEDVVRGGVALDVWGLGRDLLDEQSPLRVRWRGEAFGLDMYRVLAGSRIVLNRHIEVAEGHANNMRLYEATALGALLLTDEGSNLQELFEPGRELVTYRDAPDAIGKIQELLVDEPRRLEIARAGQQRTLTEHTYERRIPALADALAARIASKQR